MKLVSFLTYATVATGTAFLFGLAFDLYALGLFGIAITVSILLVAAKDYMPAGGGSPELRFVPAMSGHPSKRRRKYKLPFAA